MEKTFVTHVSKDGSSSVALNLGIWGGTSGDRKNLTTAEIGGLNEND